MVASCAWRTAQIIRVELRAKNPTLNQPTLSISVHPPENIQMGATRRERAAATVPPIEPPQRAATITAGKKVRNGIRVSTRR